MMTPATVKFRLFQFLLILLPLTAYSGNISFSNRLQGSTGSTQNRYSPIAPFNTVTVADPEFGNTGNIFIDQGYENRVTLRYTGASLNTILHNTAWSFQVNYTIFFYQFNAPTTSQTGSLTINFDPAAPFEDIAVMRYTGSTAKRKIAVRVDNITPAQPSGISLTEDFTLEAEILTNRIYKMNLTDGLPDVRHRLPYPASAAEPAIIDPQVNNTVEFTWDYFPGAEAYEIEWEYVYAEAPGFIYPINGCDFSQANHVIVSDNHYQVTLAYEEGYIFYRVRPLSRHYQAPEKWISGAYFNFEEDYFILSKSHDDNRNWIFGAAYAENGLKKEVITYYDGTMRQRQAVTRNNTDNKAIVQSTYYDYEGRPALSTLPTPNRSSADMKFYANYNLSGSIPFSKVNFDNQNKISNPDPINAGLGGTYYSAANTQMAGDGSGSYIPEASGYAYVRTLYGIDGLVQKQSAAGITHKAGSGHETETYVATPLQEKLDLLFGMEAGHSRYYRQYAVKDANGQLAVSYENMRGQVVATALAGEAPAAMHKLPGAQTGHTINADLNNSNIFYPAQQAWINHTELFVPSAGWYKFNYTLNSGWYTSLCQGGSYSCQYKLRITVFDGCNMPTDDDPNYQNNGHNIVHETIDYTFGANDPAMQSTGDFWVYFPNTGTYIVEKKLSLNETAIASAVADYRAAIDPASPTYQPSQLCISQTLIGGDETIMNSIDLSDCQPCSTCTTQNSVGNCDALYQILLADMSPGGQYFDDLTTQPPVTTPSDDWMKTWVWANSETSPTAKWTNAAYFDQAGNLMQTWDDVRNNWNYLWLEQNITGTTDPSGNYNFGNTRQGTFPNYTYTTSNQQLFSDLIQFHPEYCHFDWCQKTSESIDFDMALFSNNTLAWAQTQGYITGGVADITALLNADPFFNDPDFSSYALTDYKTAMQVKMQSGYSSVTPSTMWNYALSLTGNCTGCGDQNWQVFVATYVAEKRKLMEEFKTKDFGCAYLYDAANSDGVADCNRPFQVNYIESYLDMASGDKACGFKIRVNKPVQFTVPSGPVNHPFKDVIADFNNNSICEKVATSTFTINAVTGPTASVSINSVNISGSVGAPANTPPAQFAAQLVTQINSQAVTPEYYASAQGATITLYASPGSGVTPNGYSISVTGINTSALITMSGGVDVLNCNPPLPQYQNCFCFLMDQLVEDGVNKGLLAANATASAQAAYIATSINTGYAAQNVTVTLNDVLTWRTNCTNSFNNSNYPTHSPETWNTANYEYSITVPGPIRCWDPDPVSACTTDVATIVSFSAEQELYDAIELSVNDFERRLRAHCLGQVYTREDNVTFQSSFAENFTVSFTEKEYHYTLYYYDLAGNLTRTVPPEAVQYFDLDAQIGVAAAYTYSQTNTVTFTAATPLRQVIATCRLLHNDDYIGINKRAAVENAIRRQPQSTEAPLIGDYHELVTNYKYNTLNQPTESRIPDHTGSMVFWYDTKGRVRLSQDARQAAASPKRYNYIKMDALGRVTESGELETNVTVLQLNSFISAEDPANGVFFPDNVTGSPVRREVNLVFYDDDLSITGLSYQNGTSYNRNRVTHRIYQENYNGALTAIQAGTYSHATHYAYDVHGNVKELVQDDPTLTAAFAGQRFKRVLYFYDLISGNVKEVHTQPGQVDQFMHRYSYDADNRVTNVYTSRDGILWDLDAEYYYYQHGPLARTELGDRKIQGLDHIYTINGWMKGINSNTLDKTRDPGNDSKYGEAANQGSYCRTAPNLHRYVAADAAAYSLHFFIGDYQAIEAQTSVQQFTAGQGQISNVAQAGPDLYNGNISRMVTTITDIDPGNSITDGTALPLLMVYQYDQLNRIREARSYGLMDAANNQWQTGTIAASGDYYNKLTYDANGNILTQQRNGVGAVIDNLTYNYTTRGNGFPSHRTNQLRQVTEDAALADCSFADDINKNQQTNNYIYDAIGNLVVDKQNYIYGANDASGAVPGIVWNSNGKIASITKDNTAGKYIDCNGNGIQDVGENSIVLQDLEFHYDADGQRICKIVKPHAATGGVKPQADWIYTYYLRDPQGTVLNVYERRNVNSTAAFTLEEQYVYGAARTGMVNRYVNLLTAGAPGSLVKRKVGEKVYEIANHLGNVITTLKDLRNAVDANTDGAVDCFKAVVMSVTDYSAFGVPLAERTYNAGAYRYSMNGQEKEDDLGSGVTTAEYWMYDAKLGRRWNVDPVIKPFRSGYDAFSNNPVNRVDPNGDDDFFNAQGLYLFSTPTGNNIRIITSVNWHLFISIPRPPYLPTITNERQIKYAVENSMLIHDYTWKWIPEKMPDHIDPKTGFLIEGKVIGIAPRSVNDMFINIMFYYANQLGIPREILKGVAYNTSYFMGTGITTGEIRLGTFTNYGAKPATGRLISDLLSDKYNFRSFLVHEYYHSVHQRGIDCEENPKAHLDTYFAQVSHSTWNQTTTDFKNTMVKNITEYINSLPEKDRKNQMDRFAKVLKINAYISPKNEVSFEKYK